MIGFKAISKLSQKLKIRAKKLCSRGSFKDPLLCLQILSVFLFVLIVFLPYILGVDRMDYPKKIGEFFLASISSTVNEDSLFIDQQKVSKIFSPDLSFIQKNSLIGISPPITVSSKVLGSLIGDFEGASSETNKEIIEYIVQSEDTLSSVAEKFNISLNTILWANDLNKNSKIKAGQKLIILPVSGIIHYVQKGDTVAGIAEKYKSKTSEILSFNELSGEGDIYIGDILIIPNGVMPPSTAQQQQFYVSVPLPSGQFIVPVSSPYMITQGLHWYNAVDFSNPGIACGKPVFAAAGGRIQKTGYDRTAGNYVRISHTLHSNEVITFYGHLSAIIVKSGAEVKVGDIIGYIGNTGYTKGLTGCHVHFEVRGAQNPFAR